MKMNNTGSHEFTALLETFLTEYMPFSKGLSKNTINSYKFTFRLLLNFLFEKKGLSADIIKFSHLDFDTINGFLLWIEQERKCSVATRNLRLTALSAFAKYAQNRSIDAALTFSNAVNRIPVKTAAEAPRTTFTLEELKILFKLPNTKTQTGLRDKVMLNLMYACGGRAQEICDLTVRNVQFSDDITKITINGKGNKIRRINIAKPAADLLREYMIYRGIDKNPDSHIFSSQTNEHMTISCIEVIFKKYVTIAKHQNPMMFCEKHYSPHTMRHTTATHMLESGVPLMAIKNFLGHASVTTTERYAALSQATVNQKIREWNAKWFPKSQISASDSETALPVNHLPSFLT
jgi:site-specific recombinase XerD